MRVGPTCLLMIYEAQSVVSSYNLTGQTPKLADALVSAFRWIFVTQGVYTQVMATDTEMV